MSVGAESAGGLTGQIGLFRQEKELDNLSLKCDPYGTRKP